MKTINTLATITLAIILSGLAISCESISNPEPINAIDSTRTATIQGTAYANLDETNDTTGTTEEDFERVPQNTTVKVTLDAEDFASSIEPGVEYGSLSFETTVDASGNFSIEVPALGDPVNAEVYLDSFTATQVQADSSEEQRNYSPQFFPYNITVVAGLTSFSDAIYQSN